MECSKKRKLTDDSKPASKRAKKENVKGTNVYDMTAIHPESYECADK